MINKIEINNFKVLKEAVLNCSNLNLFAGINGMGKSSALQVLLLLRQSYKNDFLKTHGLALKGKYVDVGVGKDALYQFAKKEEVIFKIGLDEEESYKWHFAYDSDSDMLPFISAPEEVINYSEISLFNNNFQYLNADRFVPKNFYLRSDFEVVQNRNIGIRGEYVAHFLSVYGIEIIPKILCRKESRSNSLIHQVWAWMSLINPGIKINVEELNSIDAIKLAYQFETESGYTNEIKPPNVGFGITYALPVVVSLLSAKKDDLLIIENPESHLHPKGQSIIGELMALSAKNGVQIFVETHSDHILNGIRVSVANGIHPSLIKFFFFNRALNNSEHYSQISCPVIDDSGRIDEWPEGFFDEWDNNLMKLL